MRLTLVLVLVLASALTAAFAAEPKKAAPEKSKPAPLAPLSPDDQMRIMRSLAAVDENFKTFALTFPDTQPKIIRTDPKGRISVHADRWFGDYQVSFWTSAVFTADYSQATDPRCEIFGAYSKQLLATLRPGRVIGPTKFPPQEVPEFCRNPDAYLRRKYDELGKKQ